MTGVLVQCTFANTPAVSPESKSPDWRGSRYIQIVAFHCCHRGAALPSMNELCNFLAHYQWGNLKTALKAKINPDISIQTSACGLKEKPSP